MKDVYKRQVNSGEIPAEKLDDAVGRILTTKGI